MRVLMQAGLISIGSIIGGLSRWGVRELLGRWLGSNWPYATFFINITGSLFLGWFATYVADKFPPKVPIFWHFYPEDLSLLVALGFTGAYTTFSSYEFETYALLQEGRFWSGFFYMFASVFLGLMAVRVGVILAQWR